MATITPVILKQNKREDNTWNVVYRVTHNRKSKYIKTHHYVDKSSIDKSFDIKMSYIIDYLIEDIKKYRTRISDLGFIIDHMEVAEVVERITGDSTKKLIDFIEFADQYVEIVKATMSRSSHLTYSSVVVLFKKMVGDKFYTTMFSSKTVRQYKELLKSEGKTPKTINIYTIILGRIFDECKQKYNNEDLGIIAIPQSPFKNIKMEQEMQTAKRSLTVEQIRAIRDHSPNKLTYKGHTTFMLIFYLCGINAKDLLDNYDKFIQNGSGAEYNRSKTKNKRNDGAFISVPIPEVAKPLLIKFKEFADGIKSHDTLMVAVNNHLDKIGKSIELEQKLTTYYARHSFATIAHNDCRLPKDDVAMALNHVDQSTKVTDIYIKPDWSIIDNVQRAVIDKLNEE